MYKYVSSATNVPEHLRGQSAAMNGLLLVCLMIVAAVSAMPADSDLSTNQMEQEKQAEGNFHTRVRRQNPMDQMGQEGKMPGGGGPEAFKPPAGGFPGMESLPSDKMSFPKMGFGTGR